VFTKDGSKQELDEAARKLVETLRNGLPSIKIGVTAAGRGSFLVEGKFTNDALLTDPGVDFISLQAYQNTQPGNVCDLDKISGNNSPSSLAASAIKLVSSTDKLDKKSLIVGLSAYELDCPQRGQKQQATGVNGTLNMYVAAKESICAAEDHLGIMGDSYFSEKTVTIQRDKGNFYANNFLSLCQIDSIRAHCGETTADGGGNLDSDLNRDCPNIIKDLMNKVVVKPGGLPRVGGEIYIRPRLNQ
jgi:hypothetical protein